MTNVLIVDDERLVQELFAHYISSASDRYALAEIISDAANAEMICNSKKVDLILMDVCTANESSGIAAAAEIKKHLPQIKIIIVTSAPEYRFIEKTRAAGADSFWYKDISESELLEVMDETMRGEARWPDKTPDVMIGLANSHEFTRKEIEVLLHLSDGSSSKDIAEEMGVTPDAINQHIKHLKERTGCTSKTQLAVLASKTKLVLPEY